MQESGEPCQASENAGHGETLVEDAPEQCGGEQVCFSIGENDDGITPDSGTCSCRCDGPRDGRPICQCLEGFVCMTAFANLSNEDGEPDAYCVAESR